MIINMVGGSGGFSPSNAILGVTAYAGSTVTISNGTVTKTVTPDKSHTLSDLQDFAIYYFGIPSGMFSSTVPWNIVATYQEEQTVATVIINSNDFYDIVLTYRVPYAYQEVEYLESNGSQYIDTLINTDSVGIFNAKVTLLAPSYIYRNFWAFGGSSANKSNNTSNNGFGIAILQSGPVILSFNQLVYSFPEYYYNQTGDFSLSILNNTYSMTVPPNNPVVYSVTPQPITCNNTLYLFAMHFNDGVNLETTNINRFHSCEIFNRQSQKVANLVPCYRKSDSVAGMYDNVNNRFLTNQGTGTFVVGSDVVS